MIRTVGILFFLILTATLAYSQTIRGTVKDAQNGEELIGANVVVKGSTTGTVTDEDGKFSLTISQQLPVTLTISYLGYIAQEIVVKKRNLSTEHPPELRQGDTEGGGDHRQPSF
jgi:hypothetical protein